MILVTIDKQHDCLTAILKVQARAARSCTCAQHFYIAYNKPHIFYFRMSGRSFLCNLWFSQTLRHKNDLSIPLSIYSLFTKNQKVWLCVRGDLTSLFFSKVAKQTEVRGDLSSNVGNKSFTSRPSDCKNYALA